MTCHKCNYQDTREGEKFNVKLCRICLRFAPEKKQDFDLYVEEKIDWKSIILKNLYIRTLPDITYISNDSEVYDNHNFFSNSIL